jgi:hypothetical protein
LVVLLLLVMVVVSLSCSTSLVAACCFHTRMPAQEELNQSLTHYLNQVLLTGPF